MSSAEQGNNHFHKTRQLVKFEDCDPAGIIFFANYFRYAQSAIAEYFSGTGEFQHFYNGTELVYPVISTSAEFKKMVRLGDILDVYISVSQIKESSLEFLFEFFHQESKTADLRIAHVCISKNSGNKQPIPQFIKNLNTASGS